MNYGALQNQKLKNTSHDEIERIHETLVKSADARKMHDVAYRKKCLRNLAKSMWLHKDKIIEAMYSDLGKHRLGALSEFGACIADIREAHDKLESWTGDIPKTTPWHFGLASSWVRPTPLGSVLIIAPWNFPLALNIQPLVGAIAAGCTAVVKPSELAPAVAQVLESVVNMAVDPDVARVVQGDIPVTQKLLKCKWDKIFYTGSFAVGKIIAMEAAKTLTPICLELGGKNPLIIDKGVDIEECVKRVIWGKGENAGQICYTIDYIVIPEELAEQFISSFINQYRKWWGDDAKQYLDLMPARIVNERHWHRLMDLIHEIEKTNGNQIVFGGSSKADREKLYIPMTLIKNPSLSSKVMKSEIFGPILPIITTKDLDDSIAFVNNMHGKHPLTLNVFGSHQSVRRVLDETQSGNVMINDLLCGLANTDLPFGGVGQSGTGQYHGKATFDTFTHSRSVMKRSMVLDSLFTRYFHKNADYRIVEKLYNVIFPLKPRHSTISDSHTRRLLLKSGTFISASPTIAFASGIAVGAVVATYVFNNK